MTRRLVLAILATVVGTLVVVGTTTAAVARWQARDATESALRERAEVLAAAGSGVGAATAPDEVAVARRVLRGVRRALRLDGVEFVRITPGGQIDGTLPAGVSESDLDAAALASGETQSGAHGSLVWAAAPRVRPQATVVAVVTQRASSGLDAVVPRFVLAGVVTGALGTVVAVTLARRLSRPVEEATGVARRLAAGDLDARLPDPRPGDDDELAGLARSINTMAEGLQRSRALEQQFLLSISHDLRTPLTSIRGYAEALADGTTADAARAAGTIVTEASRLEHLIGDLLDLAHLDARSFSLHPVKHDLRAAAVDAARAMAPLARGRGLEIAVADGPPVPVLADRERVGQILGNLLENAVKHARSTVGVYVTAAAGKAVLRVDDDGAGIAPEDRPHVFERLYRAGRDPVRAEVGSGLGLAIVHQLTEAMGGSVSAGAAPGGGARIEVVLPLSENSRGAITLS